MLDFLRNKFSQVWRQFVSQLGAQFISWIETVRWLMNFEINSMDVSYYRPGNTNVSSFLNNVTSRWSIIKSYFLSSNTNSCSLSCPSYLPKNLPLRTSPRMFFLIYSWYASIWTFSGIENVVRRVQCKYLRLYANPGERSHYGILFYGAI